MSFIVTIELLPDEVVDVKSVMEFVPGNMVRLYCESGACKVYTTASTPTSLAGYRVLTANSEYITDATSSGCWVVGIGDGAVLAADIVTVASSGGAGAGDASAANQQLEIAQLASLNTVTGTKVDAVATSDTGVFSIISFIKRGMQNWTNLLLKIPSLSNGRIPVEVATTAVGTQAPLTALVVGGISTGNGRLVDEGDVSQIQLSRFGSTVVLPYALSNDTFIKCTTMDEQQMSVSITSALATELHPYVTDIMLCTTLMEGTNVSITDSASGDIWRWYLEAGENVDHHFNVPLKGSEQGVLTLTMDNSNASFYATVTGFYAP